MMDQRQYIIGSSCKKLIAVAAGAGLCSPSGMPWTELAGAEGKEASLPCARPGGRVLAEVEQMPGVSE